MKINLLLGVFLTIGILLGVILLRTFETPEAQSPDATPDLRHEEELKDLSRRLDRVEDAIATMPRTVGQPHPDPSTDLERRLGALEASLASAPVEDGGRAKPAATGAPGEGARANLAGLSASDAVVQLKQLGQKRQWNEARQQAELLLQRDLSGSERAKVLRELGIAHRAVGEHENSEVAFTEMLRAVGRDDQLGIEANFQLAWSRFYLKDYLGAIAHAEEIVRHPQASPSRVGSSRLIISTFARYNEDPVRAREELEKILNDLGSSANPENTWVVKEAKKRLAALDE